MKENRFKKKFAEADESVSGKSDKNKGKDNKK